MADTASVFSSVSHAVELQLYRMELWPESSTEKHAVPDGLAVTVAGTGTPGAEVRDGYAVTHGVDQEFFAAWKEQNAQTAFVKQSMIHMASE